MEKDKENRESITPTKKLKGSPETFDRLYLDS